MRREPDAADALIRTPAAQIKNPAEWPGRGLRPAVTPGEEMQPRVQPGNSPTCLRFRRRPEFHCGFLSGEHLIRVLPHDAVALARNVFERRAIEDLDVTAAVANKAGTLQEAGRDGHGGAA